MTQDIERRRASQRAHYYRHREQINAAHYEWQKANPSKVRAQRRRKYLRHRDKIIQQAREWRQRNPDRFRQYLRNQDVKWPERARARWTLKKAVHDGRVEKPTTCSVCTRDMGERQRIHAHHNDYSQPFEVVWVCPACHPSLHDR